MARNPHADGIAEDLIRAFVQVGCAEVHAKTLLEKAMAEVDNGIIDVNDPEVLSEHDDMTNDLIEEISSLAELRRSMMLRLFEMYEGEKSDKTRWCSVKHLGVAAYTAWEVYQASDDDPDLMYIALDANKRFIKALSHFLGMTPTECAACFHDALLAEEKHSERSQ